MWASLAARREPAGNQSKATKGSICFEHKTWYILIHVSHTHFVAFLHTSNISPMIPQIQICYNIPMFFL